MIEGDGKKKGVFGVIGSVVSKAGEFGVKAGEAISEFAESEKAAKLTEGIKKGAKTAADGVKKAASGVASGTQKVVGDIKIAAEENAQRKAEKKELRKEIKEELAAEKAREKEIESDTQK